MDFVGNADDTDPVVKQAGNDLIKNVCDGLGGVAAEQFVIAFPMFKHPKSSP
jgi:hypothetical protein